MAWWVLVSFKWKNRPQLKIVFMNLADVIYAGEIHIQTLNESHMKIRGKSVKCIYKHIAKKSAPDRKQ